MTAKELLGHSDIQTTLNIYTHLDKEFKNKEIQKLNTYFQIKFDRTFDRTLHCILMIFTDFYDFSVRLPKTQKCPKTQ